MTDRKCVPRSAFISFFTEEEQRHHRITSGRGGGTMEFKRKQCTRGLRMTESYLKPPRNKDVERGSTEGRDGGVVKRSGNMCSSCSPVLSQAPHSGSFSGICFEVYVCVHNCVVTMCLQRLSVCVCVRACVCSCALSLVRKKRPLIEFPLISRQPRLAERDACLPAAQRHTSGVVDNGGWHFCPTMPPGSMWYMASSMKVKLS